MPLSLRIPPEKESMIAEAARKAGKTKTAFILEAVDEKLGLSPSIYYSIQDVNPSPI